MSVDVRSTLAFWVIDGEPSPLGYFQNQAMLPMPGDHVVMFPGEDDRFEVVVAYRVFEQPERDRPSVTIHATRLATTAAPQPAPDDAELDEPTASRPRKALDLTAAVAAGKAAVDAAIEAETTMGRAVYEETLAVAAVTAAAPLIEAQVLARSAAEEAAARKRGRRQDGRGIKG
jgi:hypothetical protein